MAIFRVNPILLGVFLLSMSTVWGQSPTLAPLPQPLPPPFPEENVGLPTEATRVFTPSPVLSSAERQPEPAPLRIPEALPVPQQAFAVPEVRTEPGIRQIPNSIELTSILKKQLPAENQTISAKDAPEWFQGLMQRIVRDNVPDKYVQEKDWGKTDRRWNGLDVKHHGTLQWSTKRKWKEVNDGTWKRYEVTQIAPEENLTVRIENIHDAGSGQVRFDVRLTSRLHVSGRLAKWAKGIQIYNVSADANAHVQLKMQSTLAVKLDVRKFPPDVVVTPSVTQADIDVLDFELEQLSKLRGPLVRELSGSVHDVLMEQIEEKRDRLPDKINRQIAKNQDKMTFSLSDFVSERWGTLTQPAAASPPVEDGQTVTVPPSESPLVAPVEGSTTPALDTTVSPALLSSARNASDRKLPSLELSAPQPSEDVGEPVKLLDVLPPNP